MGNHKLAHRDFLIAYAMPLIDGRLAAQRRPSACKQKIGAVRLRFP